MIKRFAKDTRANVAMMFGILLVPLIAATGAAID
jgi:Flp pilus assembly protein TadG